MGLRIMRLWDLLILSCPARLLIRSRGQCRELKWVSGSLADYRVLAAEDQNRKK